MKKPTRRDYDAFRWLPLEQWTVDKLMGPFLGNLICCKICDDYISRVDAKEHVKKHVATRKRQLESDKQKAKAARMEAMRLARELKKEEKMAGK